MVEDRVLVLSLRLTESVDDAVSRLAWALGVGSTPASGSVSGCDGADNKLLGFVPVPSFVGDDDRLRWVCNLLSITPDKAETADSRRV